MLSAHLLHKFPFFLGNIDWLRVLAFDLGSICGLLVLLIESSSLVDVVFKEVVDFGESPPSAGNLLTNVLFRAQIPL